MEVDRRRREQILNIKHRILEASSIDPAAKNKGLLEILEDATDIIRPWTKDPRTPEEKQRDEDKQLEDYYYAVIAQYRRNQGMSEEEANAR
jgi:ribosome-binding protein aMBF1 (putative translation factor)